MSVSKSLVDGHVLVDSREGKRIGPTIDFFGKANTRVKQLDYGDYVYVPEEDSEDRTVGVEVKQVHTDLFSSIVSRQLFRQVVDMVKEFPIHYLLIVGNPEVEIIRNIIIKKKNPNYHWNFTMEQWNGAYSSLCQLTVPVFAYNWNQALEKMNLLFKKSTDNKNRIYNYMTKFENPVKTFISCRKGIGEKTAQLVCDELELKTLDDLLCLNKEQLVNIKGIKDKTADKILTAIK